MKRTLLTSTAILVTVLLISSCSSDEKGENGKGADSYTVQNDKDTTASDSLSDNAKELIDAMFRNIPSPVTLSFVLHESGIEYRKELTHDPDLARDYASSYKQSLMLGVYGTDLTYSNITDRFPETMKFMAASFSLYESLGLNNAVSETIVSRMESNENNRDSMRMIISESFANLEGYLKDNDRMDIAGTILAGGVVEALYISTQVLDMNNPDPKISQLIADQKYSIKSLVGLFESLEKTEMTQKVYADIMQIWKIYEQMEEQANEGTHQMDGEVLRIGSKQKIVASTEQLVAIKELVSKLRMSYINTGV